MFRKHIANLLNRLVSRYQYERKLRVARQRAKYNWRSLVDAKGSSCIDQHLLRQIKNYCRCEFGDARYWPYLAWYTEIRNEFKEGWVPNDFYLYHLLPLLNNKHVARVSQLKSFQHILLDGYVAETLLISSGGVWFQVTNRSSSPVDFTDVLKLYDSNTNVVVKHDFSQRGRDVFFTTVGQLGHLSANFEKSGGFVVQRMITQHQQMALLHPNSVNTIRVHTLLDLCGNYQAIRAIVRFGRSGNKTDNDSFILGIDLETKTPLRYASDKIGRKFEKHPDSGLYFNNFNCPDLTGIFQFCCDAHRRIPHCRLIAWDLAIDEKGQPVLLEWDADQPGWSVAEALTGPHLSNWKDLVYRDL